MTMKWTVILLLLMEIVAITATLSYITNKYELNQSSINVFENAVLDRETDTLYVGAVNRIYVFKKNLSNQMEVFTGPKEDNYECPILRFPCNKEKTLRASHSKAILIDHENNLLINCISLFQGVCRKHHLHDLTDTEPDINLAIVANNATATTYVFLAPGIKNKTTGEYPTVLNVGTQYTEKGWKRESVPCFASRRLDTFELAHSGFSFVKTATMLDYNLRQLFPILYIYGFSSEGFSYMITVQKESTNSQHFVGKMFRVCEKDEGFFSYAELQLQCTYNGTDYNRPQTAFLSRAGTQLAKKMGIPDTEDVLYVLFTVSKLRSFDPTPESALCVYPMRRVRSIFTENIQECFKGNGNTGPQHLFSTSLCRHTPKLKIDDNYCGEFGEVNSPTEGLIPVKSEAATTLKTLVTSLTVDVVNDYTVAFVGTENGHIIKIALEAQTEGKIYEDVPLAVGSAILPSMFIDKLVDGQSLYVMTERKLMKMKLYECSQYTTCASCIGAKDPYCGWCSLENKCSLRTECVDYNLELRWLAYRGRACTTIESVTPNQIQKQAKTTELQLKVENLPSFAGLQYQCVFSYLPRRLKITTTNTTFSMPTNNVMRCETPEMHLLPPIPTDHVKMNLTIQIKGRDFVMTNFTFFDCSEHRSCSSCTMSEYKCTWCIQNHVCRHNPQDSCGANALVYGNKSVDGKTPRGPQECPRIELADGSPDKIVVPSGTKKSIKINALYLQEFMKENIRCFFHLDQGVDVQARVAQSDKPNVLSVECQDVEFHYNENIPLMHVQFHIYWQTVEKPLDNPEKIQVIMYKCSSMAASCGECISQDPKFQCGWCGDKCSIQNHCKLAWQPRSEICKDISITSINPTTGPSEGGTKLTILGRNLGKDFEDIDGGIEVANVACNPIREEFEAPSKIVCYTGRAANEKTGLVRVTVGGKEDANAPDRFTYVDPELEKIDPRQGPVSGGTKVTITGKHLDTGTRVNITIGMVECDVIEREKYTIVCETSRAAVSASQYVSARFDNQELNSNLEFSYINDPDIVSVAPTRSIVSGGINIMVNGTNLIYVQSAHVVVYRGSSNRKKRSVNRYSGDCEIPRQGDLYMVCYSPQIPNNTVPVDSVSGVRFSYGLILDNIFVNRTEQNGEHFTIYPDPIFEEFAGSMEKSYQSKTDNYLTINGRNLNLGFNSSDVVVKIGKGFCNVTSIDKHGNQLNCKPPKNQPPSEKSSKYPEIIVQVGRNYSKLVGYLKYEKPELLPLPVIIGLGVGGGVVVLLVIFFFVLWCIKSRENLSMKKKWQIQMDNLEVKVAKECKEAFAELQTDMTELTSDHFGQVAIPFWDYRTYCMRVLFPQDEDSHPVIRDLDVDPNKRENIEHGLKLFSQLIGNRTFLLTFVRTLEANKKFSMRERVNVASLISVALQTRMEYATDILKTLLAELIEKSVEGKNHPKLLLRRTESVAEKMLTNWFTFLLYKFLRECAGEPLFMLYQAIKQQTSKGPVDSITSEARYSLSEDKLIRQQVDYKPMTIYVQDKEQFGAQSHPVKVLDCDTISQVKEKILDAIYKNAPFSSRPTKQNVDLVLFAQSPSEEYDHSSCHKMILSTVDNSTKHEADFKRLNTLGHYQVPDGAYMALMPKQTPSLYDLSSTSEKSNKSFDYKRFDSSVLYSSRSPSLNRTASPQTVNIDIETSSMNGGTKYYHLVKQHDQESTKEGDRGSKMVSEIYLTRLLATKGTLQQFVDDLFERIFSTCHRGTSLPLAIKYMFDFLDDQALLHNVQDQDVVHTWKSNSLPLRFWVNVIKNPNFVFDIYKSNIVDSCLSVVAQNFMDSCSMSEHKLGKDSPSSKLLYAKDIPTYKKWVERYYQDIKMMPAISDQDMTAMMTDESRTHHDEFNVNAALYELYKYVQHYSEDLIAALDEDEFARKNRLNNKLEQVHIAMNGDAFR